MESKVKLDVGTSAKCKNFARNQHSKTRLKTSDLRNAKIADKR